jgi:hypothetical protein
LRLNLPLPLPVLVLTMAPLVLLPTTGWRHIA